MLGTSKHQNEQTAIIMHDEFMAFTCDTDSHRILSDCALDLGYPAAAVQLGGLGLVETLLASSPVAKMLIIDIDDQGNTEALPQKLVNLCGSDCKIIAIGTANDVNLYRQMLNAGVADYLVKPINYKDLNQAITNVLQQRPANQPKIKETKIAVVIGTRGGVGASTIAVNTGWLLAHQFKLNCLLLDLDLQFGTTSLALDLEPGRGLRHIINAADRVDSLMIASSIVVESENFSILGAEEAIDEAIHIDSGAMAALLKEVRNNYDFIIVDMPRHLLITQKRLLLAAQEIILVTELSLAGIRDTLRIKTALNNLGCTAKLTFVAARAGPNRAGQVEPAAFEKGAQIKIDFTIPEDHKTVTLAANSGKTLAKTAPAALITKSLINLASKLHGTKKVTDKTLRQSLFGSFSAGRKVKNNNSSGVK